MSSRIKLRRKQLGLTQAELALRIKVSTGMISQYEASGAIPSAKIIATMANALGVSVNYLLTGESPNHNYPNGSKIGIGHGATIFTVPVIDATQAGDWLMIVDTFEPGDAEEWIDTTIKISPKSFALRIQGNSMQDSNNPRSIPEGAIVICDPSPSPQDGDIVVVKFNGSSTIKKLTIDAGKFYLTPLNADYRPFEMTEEMEIIAVAKSAQISL